MISRRVPRALKILCLGLLLALAGASFVFSYALNGYRWPDGTQITMHLQLTHASGPLQDGSASWNDSAADALNVWNQYIDAVQFVPASPTDSSGNDGANEVLFSSTVYGESWPTNVLAVTLRISNQGNLFTETDVLFNDNLNWDSYRGPLQGGGPSGTYDLHRVALHEFGHVLGLDHPDQHGQSVTAIMNSIISDLDQLADDDIAGARAIYPAKITSSLSPPAGRSGDDFFYQVLANNHPSSYSASGLPSGLVIDSSTGVINGRCTTSGIFPIDIAAQGAHQTAIGRIQITINPLPILSSFSGQVQIGDNFSYQISAGNNPTTYDATGLPAGLQIDKTSGVISGVPQVSGNFQVRVFARSALSEAAATIFLSVMPARITSGTSAGGIELGASFSYRITATNNPRAFAVSNLPPGVQFDAASATISGTPSSAGNFTFIVSAQTDYGPVQASVFLQVFAPRITSSLVPNHDIGSAFLFQVTASNHPYRFSATGLPPGLRIDTVTGEITGVPELSGFYQVQVSAEGSTGTASATLTFNILALDVPDTPVAKLPLSILGSIVADPKRSRVYAATTSGIAIIDTDSLAIVQTVPLSLFISDLNISVDGNKLWVTDNMTSAIRAIDLDSLSVATTIMTSLQPKRVREGTDGRLYVTDSNQRDVFQLDPATGATIGHFNPSDPNSSGFCTIEMSPDRKTIYVLVQSHPTVLASYAIVPGGAPQLIQRVETSPAQDYYQTLAVNPDGKSLSFVSRLNQTPDPTQVRSTADLNVVQGSMASANFPTEIAYSADGSLLFQAMQQRSRIDVFQTSSYQLARTVTLPEHAIAGDENNTTQSMAVDRTGSYLFVPTIFGSNSLYVYSLLPPPPRPAPAKSLLNISTRLRAQPGDNVLIGGFIVNGQVPKRLVLRAIGPSLPVSGKLADPVLQLFDSAGTIVAQNDNWNANRADVIAAGTAPGEERDAALVTTVPPGSYTAVVRGVNDSAGVALVEAYDLSADTASKLANISTRGKVETGDNVMIGGFILGGDQVTTIVVRALGPSLANYGVAGPLSDPTLEVHDGNGGLVAQDDDWRTYQEQPLIQTGLAPTDDRESAMILFLQPGPYTAIVRGKNDTTGVGLVEVYNLDAN